MDFSLDFSLLPIVSNPFAAMWYLIIHGGWVIFVITFLWGGWMTWVTYIREKFDASVKHIILAIDIPRENEQSPKAVEHVFSHLSGALKKGNLMKRYFHGYNQQGFSLEIVSIEGYIQFLIRTPLRHRDLVEATIYAQYPDAEITEVADYTNEFKAVFPNDKFDIWGAELKLTAKDSYPIKSYREFEHPLTQAFMDPMASTLEIMSRMKRGEQMWIQILISPIRDDWKKKGMQVIRKLIKARSENGGGGLGWLTHDVAQGVTESFTASIIPPSAFAQDQKSREVLKWPTMMQHLTPGEKAVVESIGIKISKIGFKTKIRILYLGEKGVYNRGERVPAMVGSFLQFNTLNLNGFKVDKKTKTKLDYFFTGMRMNWRKNKMLVNYKKRSQNRGRWNYVLNTEELASIYHFPVLTVKAPLVKKIEAKKSEPPVGLPLEQKKEIVAPKKEKPVPKEELPPDLPFA